MDKKTLSILRKIRWIILLLICIDLLLPNYYKVDTNDQLMVLVVFGYCYLALSAYVILRIEKIEVSEGSRLYPYRSSFIGVDQWMILLSMIFLGYKDPSFYFALTSVVVAVTEIIERLVMNRRLNYNMIFDHEKMVVNEDRYNEVHYGDISNIEKMDYDRFQISLKGKKKKVILNVDRITKQLRGEFEEELYALKAKLEME
ncbi:hypothetical protein V6R21_01975 [Limibacter armeniacum]|uniref:hypothetical protein n=1 Tax=Limibacter armeniacum TaxID=466084 RepID=UPI002FE67360